MNRSILRYTLASLVCVGTLSHADGFSVPSTPDSRVLLSDAEVNDFLLRPGLIRRTVDHGLVLKNMTRELVFGTKLPDGACRFVYTRRTSAGTKESVEIELARDPDTCESLVEVGLLDQASLLEHFAPTPTQSNSAVVTSSSTTIQAGEPGEQLDYKMCVDLSTSYSDGNNPIMATIGSSGLVVSKITDGVKFESEEPYTQVDIDRCGIWAPAIVNRPSLTVTTGGIPTKSWRQTSFTPRQYDYGFVKGVVPGASNACGIIDATVGARHENNASLIGAFDCSQGAAITYNKHGITSNRFRHFQLHEDIVISGPVEGCTENLLKITVSDAAC